MENKEHEYEFPNEPYIVTVEDSNYKELLKKNNLIEVDEYGKEKCI